jgi:hypothetical protein
MIFAYGRCNSLMSISISYFRLLSFLDILKIRIYPIYQDFKNPIKEA